MTVFGMLIIIFITCLWICNLCVAYSPTIEPIANSSLISWCTTSVGEQRKCEAFANAVKLLGRASIREELLCKLSKDKEQCMDRLDNREADLLNLEPGEVFIAGRYHSLVPIMSEQYGYQDGYYAVAVIHRNSKIRNLYDLRDKRACFPGVGQLAGWVMPLVTLMEQNILNITDCNNLVKSAAAFFGPSCAPGSLIAKFNPSGDNPQKMCDLCRGVKSKRCSSSDPFAGFQGAFLCLSEGTGDVAFVKHDTVMDITRQPWFRGSSGTDYELLCPNGLTSPNTDFRNCNWGYVPAHTIVTSSAVLKDRRKQLQDFLKKSSEVFNLGSGETVSDNWGSTGSNIGQPDWSTTGRRDQGYPNSGGQRDYYSTSSTPSPWDRDRTSNRSEYDWNNRDRNNRDRGNQDWNNRDNNNRQNYDWNRENNNRSTTDKNWNIDNRTSTASYNRSYDWNVTPGYDRGGRNYFNESGWNYNGSNSVGQFRLFDSSRYGKFTNLLFTDRTTTLVPVEPSKQTFKGYLGDYANLIRRQRRCPSPPARFCVVSEKEYEKCLKMRTAFRAQMLKPDLSCIKADSQIACMSLIKDSAADLTVLDAGDIYKGGQMYGLMPIIAEQYDLEGPGYYVVAVAKQPDKETDLLYLKGKKSCHAGIGTAAGWIVPMGFLLSSERMRSYGCNAVRAASEFFQKSCVPGVLSREYTYGHWGYDNLCDLCHGSSYHYCSRESHEPFYGHTGALRCIVEGGGDIAFVKHTTILENTAGNNRAWWARPMMPDDFELLCRDGTRAMFNQYTSCNLGKVSSNAIVTSRYRTDKYVNSYIDLFMYAQQFYGSKFTEDFTFKMFVSEGEYHDLIFQDATKMLRVVTPENRDYIKYLGPHFVQSVRLVDCTAGARSLQIANFALAFALLGAYWFSL